MNINSNNKQKRKLVGTNNDTLYYYYFTTYNYNNNITIAKIALIIVKYTFITQIKLDYKSAIM